MCTPFKRSEFSGDDVCLNRSRNKIKTRTNKLELLVVKLFCLYQDFLTHADLPEIVKKTCVLDLAQIFAAEGGVFVRTVRTGVDCHLQIVGHVCVSSIVPTTCRLSRLHG